MDSEAYWYFVNGHLKQHINPPTDPSTTTFVTIRTRDIGYGRVKAEVIPSIEGHYLKEIIYLSDLYETPKNFRDRIEKDIKKMLTDQRRITDWVTQERKQKQKKSPVKRCKCK